MLGAPPLTPLYANAPPCLVAIRHQKLGGLQRSMQASCSVPLHSKIDNIIKGQAPAKYIQRAADGVVDPALPCLLYLPDVILRGQHIRGSTLEACPYFYMPESLKQKSKGKRVHYSWTTYNCLQA